LSEGNNDTRAAIAKGEATNLPAWIQNISMKGDLRLRDQADWAANSNVIRDRQRLRLRLGFDTRIVDDLKAGFGIATGSEKISDKTVASNAVKGDSIIDAEPTSTNATFANGFGKEMLMVDYAFLEYNPVSWLKVTGGKMKSGTEAWEPCDLLWDTDINPDGLAVTASKDVSSSVNLFLNGSWLTMNELNSTVNNPDVYIAQPGIAWKANDNLTIKAAYAYEQFNVNGRNLVYYGQGSAGITPTFDYLCSIPSVEISYKELVGRYSLALFGETVTNGDSKPTSDKNGACYGVRFGDEKIAALGQWQVVAMSRRLENNAWLNKLGDSDAYGGLVNSSGSEIIGTVGITRSASFGIDYYNLDAITGPSVQKSLIQFDIVYKF
jgi:hypothetical protein